MNPSNHFSPYGWSPGSAQGNLQQSLQQQVFVSNSGLGDAPQQFLFSRAGQSSERELLSYAPEQPQSLFTGQGHNSSPQLVVDHQYVITNQLATPQQPFTLASLIQQPPPTPPQQAVLLSQNGGYVVFSPPQQPPSPQNIADNQSYHVTYGNSVTGVGVMGPPPQAMSQPQQSTQQPTIFFTHHNGNSGSASGFLQATMSNSNSGIQVVQNPPAQQPQYVFSQQQQQQFLVGPQSQMSPMASQQFVVSGPPMQQQHPQQQSIGMMHNFQAPMYSTANAHNGNSSLTQGSGSMVNLVGGSRRPSQNSYAPAQLVRPKKSKKSEGKTNKDSVKDVKDRAAVEKALRCGKPFSEEPFQLDVSKKQLIVNFVSQSVSDDEFQRLFEQFGILSASRIIYDKHTHRSKGYGFVYFKRGEDAVEAIRSLNGFELHGKAIKVGYATPQRPTPPTSPRGEGEAVGDDGDDASDSEGDTQSQDEACAQKSE